MSRSHYSDDEELNGAELNRWRNAVSAAIAGKRGQAMLREMLVALDAMSEKVLIKGELVSEEGQFCALGAIGAKRGIDLAALDDYDPGDIAKALKVARALAAEIVYQNDECSPPSWYYEDNVRKTRKPETRAERWTRMREWVVANIGVIK
jgi:hypothetical protein